MPNPPTTSRSILHLTQLADTDILPPLFEFRFFEDSSTEIAAKLTGLNFSNYRPRSCFEVLSPKTRLSFRIAHQLYPTDTLLYTAAVIEVGPAIETLRLPVDEGPFSYRFVDDEHDPQLYSNTGTYHDWLVRVRELCVKSNPFEASKSVIETDIADFYPRIYFHRIEHFLDDCQAPNSVRKIIEGIIKFSRAHQSHGLPVGTAASRLLAEGLMNDTDRMLNATGLSYARYVDDYRIIAENDTQAHSVLCRLAEHLMLTEGFSLNAAKTKIVDIEQEDKIIEDRLTDVFTSGEYADLNKYFQLVYDGEDVSAEDIEGIEAGMLVEKLREIMQRDSIDYASLKVILKALQAVEVENPLEILTDFSELLYYTPRDFCILLGSLSQRYPTRAEEIATRVVDLVTQQPFSEMSLSRLWVAHLFVSQALPITTALLTKQHLTKNVIERRQALLLKGILKDRAYFREQRRNFMRLATGRSLRFFWRCLVCQRVSTLLG